MIKKIFTPILLILLSTTIAICQKEDGLIETEYGTLHYKTFGTGEPLLIINGGPGLDCEGFNHLAELFSDKYMTILYDQRGTGKSTLNTIDTSTVTMDLMANDIEIIRKELNIDKWVVLGHSFGGWMAEHYATLYSDKIKGLILSSSGGIDMEVLSYVGASFKMRLSQAERDSVSYWNKKIKEGDTTRYARYKKFSFYSSAYLYDKKFVPQIAERLTDAHAPGIHSLVFKDMRKMHFDCKESLKDFKQPVLIIQGRQDVVGDEAAYKAHLVFPNSKLVFINKSCHYAWLEQSEKYKAEVEDFITSID